MDALLRDGHFDGYEGWWRTSWLPVFQRHFSADAYCVASWGRMFEFLHDEDTRKLVFRDVDDLIETYSDELAANMWEASDGGRLDFKAGDEAFVMRRYYQGDVGGEVRD